jgi:hypothetical protein
MDFLLPSLILVILALIGLCLWLYKSSQDLKHRMEDLEANPEYWRVLPPETTKQFENLTHNIFDKIQKESDSLVESEIQDVKSLEGSLSDKVSLENREFYNALKDTLTKLSKQLEDNLSKTETQNAQYLDTQQKQILEWQQAIETETKNKINDFLEKFEANMSQFLITTQQNTLDSINLELKSARSLIDSYKSQQLSIIEENIVAVLERTLSIVLARKLSLQDQMDLVYEALEKAKQEKFLV